jgi:hypothetical protein
MSRSLAEPPKIANLRCILKDQGWSSESGVGIPVITVRTGGSSEDETTARFLLLPSRRTPETHGLSIGCHDDRLQAPGSLLLQVAQGFSDEASSQPVPTLGGKYGKPVDRTSPAIPACDYCSDQFSIDLSEQETSGVSLDQGSQGIEIVGVGRLRIGRLPQLEHR